ncbi:MAG: hypothetical protein AAF632_12530 [Bacteroidota bacterium]
MVWKIDSYKVFTISECYEQIRNSFAKTPFFFVSSDFNYPSSIGHRALSTHDGFPANQNADQPEQALPIAHC